MLGAWESAEIKGAHWFPVQEKQASLSMISSVYSIPSSYVQPVVYVFKHPKPETPSMLIYHQRQRCTPLPLPHHLTRAPQIINIQNINSFPDQHIPDVIPQAQWPSRQIPIPNLQPPSMRAPYLPSDNSHLFWTQPPTPDSPN